MKTGQDSPNIIGTVCSNDICKICLIEKGQKIIKKDGKRRYGKNCKKENKYENILYEELKIQIETIAKSNGPRYKKNI